MNKLHDRLLVGLLGTLALALIPLASNRPFFWALNGILLAAAALLYVAANARPRLPLRHFTVPGVLVGVTIGWMLVQLLPLPAAVGPAAWAQAGEALGRDLGARITLDPAATIGMVIRYLSYVVIFFLAAQISVNPKRAQRFLVGIFWLAVAESAYAIVALLGLGDTILFAPKWSYLGFATGTFVNRNHLATFLGFGAVLGTGLLLQSFGYMRAPARRQSASSLHWDTIVKAVGIYGTGLVILASGILLSGSRMGAAATVAGILTMFAFVLLRFEGRRLGLASMLAGLVAAGGALVVFSGTSLLDRLGSIESNADERLLLYRQVAAMIADRPLTGYGGGAFADAFPTFHALPLSADVTWDAAHNLYLELMADLGVFGLLPLALTAWVLLLLVRASARAGADESRTLTLFSGIGVIVLAAIHSSVDFSLQIEANVLVFLAVIAASFAQARVSRKEGRGNSVSTSDLRERDRDDLSLSVG